MAASQACFSVAARVRSVQVALPAPCVAQPPAELRPPDLPVPAPRSHYVGRYGGQAVALEVTATRDSELALGLTSRGDGGATHTGPPTVVRQLSPGTFASLEADLGEYPVLAFVFYEPGRATHITSGRAYPRVS